MKTIENAETTTTKTGATKHTGSCHCGAVRFTAVVDVKAATRCNCSICTKIAQTGCIAKPSAFELLAGQESLGTYAFGGMTATRFFCKHCGVHCFGRGHLAQLGGDYVGVNVNCLDDVELSGLAVMHWDGRHDNWMAGPRAAAWPIFAG
jgi:hypothetical protein